MASREESEKANYEYITQSIEDGSYYKRALDWYLFKFCKPISERIYWFIVAALFVIMIYKLYNQIQDWYPLKINRPIVLINTDSEFKQVVRKMENPYRNADYAILRYLIRNYIKMREEYLKGSIDLLKIDHRLKKITNNSTREISKEFQKIFDTDDLRNPLKRLGRSGSRKIEVISLNLDIKKLSFFDRIKKFNKLIEMPRNAVVTYKVYETSARRKKEELWQVRVTFNYAGVIIDSEKNNITLTEFTVTDYKNKKLK